MMYLLAVIGLTPGGISTVHSYTNNTKNNTMKQSTQNGTYIIIRIHKHSYKNTYITIRIHNLKKLNRSIQNIQPYRQ